MAVGVVIVAVVTGRLHDEGFGWFLVVLLIVASAGLGARITTHARLFRTPSAPAQGEAGPS